MLPELTESAIILPSATISPWRSHVQSPPSVAQRFFPGRAFAHSRSVSAHSTAWRIGTRYGVSAMPALNVSGL